MQSSNKILSNTLILYARLIISAVVGIFSTRIVLQTLGVNDYGIFNLVIGVVGMIAVLNSAMATSTQRFLSHTMGSGNLTKLKKIFATGLTIHLFLGFFIALLLAFTGEYIIRNYLNLPAQRLDVASKIFLFVIISSFFTIITTPFDGSLTSNENFKVIAFAEMAISLTNFISAVYLLYTGYDKLIIYAALTTLSTVGIAITKQIYCVTRYKECSIIPRYFDKSIFKEMLSFAGWNLFGSVCNLARGQGLSVAMNIYFGVVVNAANGIAGQVNGQIYSLSSIVTKAIYPQLMKSEGEGDRNRMFRLSVLTTKIPFILMILISIPLLVEMKFVLDLWLKEVPRYAVSLTSLGIILLLISTLSYGLIASVQSIGKIKVYQIVTGTLLILGLPIAIIFFKHGYNVLWAVYITIFFEAIAHFFRLFFLKQIASISVRDFLIKVDLRLISITLIGVLSSYWLTLFMEPGFVRLGFVIITSGISIVIATYFLLLEKDEKSLIKKLLNKAQIRL